MTKGDTEVSRSTGDALGWGRRLRWWTPRSQFSPAAGVRLAASQEPALRLLHLGTACKRRYQRLLAVPAVPLWGLPQLSLRLCTAKGACVLPAGSRCQVYHPEHSKSRGPAVAGGSGFLWSLLSTDLPGSGVPLCFFAPPLDLIATPRSGRPTNLSFPTGPQ